MSHMRKLVPSSRFTRTILIAAIAFTLGGTSVAQAGPVVSGFVGLIDGTNSAAINASRELSVVDTVARSHLANVDGATARLAFDAAGNLKTAAQGTQAVSGSVNVGNFPATQAVSGTVNIGNLPTTQNVSATTPLPVLDARVTTVSTQLAIADSFFGNISFQSVNVAAFEKVRVTVRLAQGLCSPIRVSVLTIANDSFGNASSPFQIDQFNVSDANCSFSGVSRVYEVPGTTLLVAGNGAAGQTGLNQQKISLVVHGR